jgi:hypothetical protein
MRVFDQVAEEMKQCHVERNEITNSLRELRKRAFDSKVPFEEKKYIYETIQVLSGNLVDSHKSGSDSLNLLVQSTRQDLISISEKIPDLQRSLLPGSDR